ncbi:hypothetical protein [Nonomuraea sp. NPDC049480]|uniref:hypothetical protein n=1 Tax=Nonomuraea sp. NPDC049480 TaxID=3364353 RepID=UPI0037ADCF5A
MDLLSAEEPLLLAYRPRGSPLVEMESLDYLLSAAVLADLAVRGRWGPPERRRGRPEPTGRGR